jgi:hypothetical protein
VATIGVAGLVALWTAVGALKVQTEQRLTYNLQHVYSSSPSKHASLFVLVCALF